MMLLIPFFILSIIYHISDHNIHTFEYNSYKQAIQKIKNRYPEITLIDLYKYFYQSRFGPEHLITDSLIALRMLEDELKNDEIKSYKSKPDSLLIEVLLPEKKYLRIDLSLVKDRIIPLGLFFTAFLQSAQKYDSTYYEQWESDWKEIVNLIEKENIKIKNFHEDKSRIENALNQGRFVFSHSSHYKSNYKPHYRIIDYKIFKNFILPILKQHRIKFLEPH